ncbi:hypothetical protein Y032_0065g3609 [Ancylostoma ceylanicum]|uniref:Uncharacterized protein n=1 Tax=Ancylostoma ceylanicum TaxID=53326 RepID=A0A016U1V8_9BILA|nr:hypothetical protein Y032_0065g3609 [Ancylostoma ceylanicum]
MQTLNNKQVYLTHSEQNSELLKKHAARPRRSSALRDIKICDFLGGQIVFLLVTIKCDEQLSRKPDSSPGRRFHRERRDGAACFSRP